MGCFTSKASPKNQSTVKAGNSRETNDDKLIASSCKQEKWWETNGDKITASAVAESLFCYPSELLDWTKCPIESVANSNKLPLLFTFQDALSNIRDQSHTLEESDHLSTITKIMKSTGRFLRPIDVLLPKLLADQNVSRALREAGLDAATVKKEFYNLHYRRELKSGYEAVRKYCCDFLLKTARQMRTTVGREKEIRDLALTLSMYYTDAAILVGEPGVDKVAVVDGLAQRMLQGRVHPSFFDRSIVALDMGALAYRDKRKGFDEIIADIWRELRNSDTKIVIFIDDIGSIFHDAAARMALRYTIRRDRVQCIGTMTSDQYYRHIHGDAGLYRKCDIIVVKDGSSQVKINNII